MLFRVEKINKLIDEGWSIQHGGFWLKLVNNNGKKIDWFESDSKKLPGTSKIALFLGPFVAVQIRDWKYFQYQFIWLLCTRIILNLVSYIFPRYAPIIFSESFSNAILTNVTGSNGLEALSYIFFISYYSKLYPYRRWIFADNFKEISPVLSIPIGLFLLLLIHSTFYFIFDSSYFG